MDKKQSTVSDQIQDNTNQESLDADKLHYGANFAQDAELLKKIKSAFLACEDKTLLEDKTWLEDMPDIRQLHEESTLHSSGAETLFCDEVSCKKEKDKLFKMSGLPSNETYIDQTINELVERVTTGNERLKEVAEQIKKDKTQIEALLMALNYDFQWSNGILRVSKSPNNHQYFPNGWVFESPGYPVHRG